MSLTPAQEVAYGAVIDLILQKSDLTTISAKKVRKELAEQLGIDVSANKEAISQLIIQRFDKIQTPAKQDNNAVPSPDKVGGVSQPAVVKQEPRKRKSDSGPNTADSPRPHKRQHPSAEDDDAAFAARLQDEENRRGRPTRGGVVKKRNTTKAKTGTPRKHKSATRVRAEGDERSSGDDIEPVRKGGFHKMMTLSTPLAELLNETALSRPQTVKRIWQYVREHDLQNPQDKRQILCDDAMRRVFKSDSVHMFTMNKILAQNLYSQDE